MTEANATPKSGQGVDAAGNPVVDPTLNVRELVLAAIQRQDDLRVEAERLSAAKHRHSREIIDIHAAHAKELREAETKRLDAIREVDVSAATQIANQVLATAETLRTMVSTTADTLAKQTSTITAQLADRISQLERSSYEGSGKSAGGQANRADSRSNVLMLVAVVSALIAGFSLLDKFG